MTTVSPVTSVLITVALIALCAVAGLAVWRIDSAADRGSGLPDPFAWDMHDQWNAGQSQLGYTERSAWDLALQEVRGIAVGPQDRIFVAGDQSVQVLGSDGQQVRTISLGGPPQCVAVGGARHAFPGRLYVSVGNQIEVWDLQQGRIDAWTIPGDDPIVTSIAVADRDLFVADAASRRVLKLDLTGKMTTTIGESLDSQSPGFIIPSPFFDIAMGPEGELYVANPGARRLERYTSEGALQSIWGSASSQITGFFGCCNPVHFAIFPDGRFATSEKGIPRVKVYRANGDFECLVAGPPQLGVSATDVGDPRSIQQSRVFDVAVDSRRRVLVLDPIGRRILIYGSHPGFDASGQEAIDE